MDAAQLASIASRRLTARNPLYADFFAREADGLALACQKMADRFLRGGRLVAFGRGVYASDAQHVSVEFVHPVIVGKRALPALDVSGCFGPWLDTGLRPEDIVMGFGPPGGDPEVCRALSSAATRGSMTLALPGRQGDYAVECFSADPFQHQEIIEILYHTLWETVHVFFEHRELDSGAGDASFLYPFLGGEKQSTNGVPAEVAASIRMKVAEDAELRGRAAADESAAIAAAANGMGECIRHGGKLLLFGNGGSATDANDWALDCVSPPPGLRPVPAVSLAAEPAVLTALANDVGTEVIFLRQLIAQAGPYDAAIAISTSGGSRNVIAALVEARRRGLATFALLGYDGGEIVRQSLADFPVVVRSDYIPRIQEVQASIYHVIRELLELTSGELQPGRP
jgi:D-sedoheptulose 7-phosphate isomerase